MRNILSRRWLAATLLVLALAGGVALAQGLTYHGNVKSRIFHSPSCKFYGCAACTAVFTSREAAVAAGYRPCKVCNP